MEPHQTGTATVTATWYGDAMLYHAAKPIYIIRRKTKLYCIVCSWYAAAARQNKNQTNEP